MSTSLPGILPGQKTHEDLDFSTISMEDLSELLPCDVEESRCQSSHSEPATWLVTHQGAQAKCTVMLCEPCVVGLQNWIARCCVQNGLNGFACVLCGTHNMNYKAFITRKM